MGGCLTEADPFDFTPPLHYEEVPPILDTQNKFFLVFDVLFFLTRESLPPFPCLNVSGTHYYPKRVGRGTLGLAPQ